MASQGSLEAQNHGHQRVLDVTIRAGSPKFDNYRRVGNDRPRFTIATPIALEDSQASIRQTLWLATDRVYRAVSNRLIRLKAWLSSSAIGVAIVKRGRSFPTRR